MKFLFNYYEFFGKIGTMKQYVRNILIYSVALLAILAFIMLFSNSLKFYDSINDSWVEYKVNAYTGDNINGETIYKGSIIPIFGFVLPLAISIALIVESFKKSWLSGIKVINTVLAVLLFLCVLAVLLTKELFLTVNDLGTTNLLKNGTGPVISAIASACAGIILLFATWLPFKSDIKFIERDNNGTF